MYNPKEIKHIVLDGHSLTLESFVAVARYGATVELADSALKAMEESRALAEKIADEGRVAYGITTGFGDFQRVAVSNEMSNQLSTNLILSHCTATGEPFAEDVVRGMLLLRANALCVGVSGVRPILVQMMIEMLNKGVHPVVPQKGSLGSAFAGQGHGRVSGREDDRCRGDGQSRHQDPGYFGEQGRPGSDQRYMCDDLCGFPGAV